MEFPFNHNHHHNNEQQSNTYPHYDGAYSHAPPPPPPQVSHVSHISHHTPQPPPQPHLGSPNYPPPPHVNPTYPQQPPPHDHHHEYGSHNQPSSGSQHSFKPHMPGFIQAHLHHNHHSTHPSSNDVASIYNNTSTNLEGYFRNKTTYRINCKASGNTFCVGIRHNKVVLTYADPNDPTQHWYKDEKYSTKVKDEDGYPSFALVNKATGQAMKHPISGEPVELVPYKPDHLDGSLLWTESKDLGSGYRTIRNVNNVKMVLDAFNGDKDHGGVHDGTFLSIFKCWKGDNQNQQWKTIPY